MSRQIKSEASRVEYSEPEQLDKILDFLRRNREDAQAGRRRPLAFDPVSDKIVMPAAAEPAGEAAPGGGAVTGARSAPAGAAGTPAGEASGDLEAHVVREFGRRKTGAGKPADKEPAADGVPAEMAPEAVGPAAKPARTVEAGGAPASAPGERRGADTRPGAEPAAAPAASAGAGKAPAASPARAAPAAPTGPAPSLGPADLLASGSELDRAIRASRESFVALCLFSLAINVLMLAGPLFMLQVYDRVMASGSLSTLAVLSAITAGVYGVIGLLELVRSRITVRVGVELDRRVGDRVFEASLRQTLEKPGQAMSSLRELDSLRQFIGGPGPVTLFDVPWTPVYLLVVFALNWWLGIAATIGAGLLVLIAWMSETRSRAPLAEANKAAQRSIDIAESGQRNAEAITAMGMVGACRTRWQAANAQSLGWQVLASDRLGTLSSVSKTLRLLLQSMMLAIGAALAIKGDLSAGSIVAGTILFGRALAPVEQAVGQWRQLVKAREAYGKVAALLERYPAPPRRTSLPKPAGHLSVESLRVAAPETRTVILAGVTFRADPGTLVGIIGPSASGKSTLARAIVGLWPAFGGQVRLDGARLEQWDGEELGRHIGYLPQDVELFAGSVRENISRFRPDATDADVVAAAKAAHAHDMIMALPQSYETEIGTFGTYLSAGQRQRIGLARALFADPALVVLDEPNANLDRTGDEALSAAIDGMRQRGQTVVLVSHRVQAIGKADYLLYIEKGQQKAFGPRAEVIRYLQGGPAPTGTGGGPAPPAPPASRPQVVAKAEKADKAQPGGDGRAGETVPASA